MSERLLADDKFVRVMCDYCADGLWAKDGCGVGPDELPVPDATKARLRAWQDWYERDSDPDEPRNGQSRFDVGAFAAEGLAIAKEIKAALPDWTVVYFDESRADAKRPRHEFEYEVTP